MKLVPYIRLERRGSKEAREAGFVATVTFHELKEWWAKWRERRERRELAEIWSVVKRIQEENASRMIPDPNGDFPKCKPSLGSDVCERCGQRIVNRRLPCPAMPREQRWRIAFESTPKDAPAYLADASFTETPHPSEGDLPVWSCVKCGRKFSSDPIYHKTRAVGKSTAASHGIGPYCSRRCHDLDYPPDTKPGDWPEDFSHENGNYNCRCMYCGDVFTGHKRRVVCRRCAFSPCRDGEGNMVHDYIGEQCVRCGAPTEKPAPKDAA